jgi:uncharacterized protein (TIGR03083 family)
LRGVARFGAKICDRSIPRSEFGGVPRRVTGGIMAKQSPWPTIHAERSALAADLEGLNAQQWSTPSLCADWTVQDVLGHMTATAKISPGAFLGKLVSSGFSLKKMQAKDIATETAGYPAATLARFKAEVNSSKHPPGPNDTWLGEMLVHAEDIRRPLGIKHDYPIAAAVQVADFYKGSNLIIGAKKRIAGLRLRANDTDWSHGKGAEVSGPIVSLVMAMTGRKGALADLSGDGVDMLSSRA